MDGNWNVCKSRLKSKIGVRAKFPVLRRRIFRFWRVAMS